MPTRRTARRSSSTLHRNVSPRPRSELFSIGCQRRHTSFVRYRRVWSLLQIDARKDDLTYIRLQIRTQLAGRTGLIDAVFSDNLSNAPRLEDRKDSCPLQRFSRRAS